MPRMHTDHHPLPITDPALAPWLDRCGARAPEYGGTLSTHLPMALHALHALGAPPQRLAALFDRIAPSVPLLGGVATAGTAGNGAPPLGDINHFSAWRHHLAAQVQPASAPAVLVQWLPALLPGVAAAAFHGLIRTAHGVAAGHAGEVVNGLAYWAARHMPLQPLRPAGHPASEPAASRSLGDWLVTLQSLPTPPGPPGRMIAARMQAWAGADGFHGVAPSLALGPDTLANLVRHAAALYAASGSFTLLHAVTAGHALLVLRPWLPPDPLALQPVVVALAAALRASGLASLQAPALHQPPPPWADTVAAAIRSDDEHVIKLVHACRDLQAQRGGAVFQAAAARAVVGAPRAPG